MEATRTSQVPGEPSCSYAVFSDPGRTDAPGCWNVVGAAPAASTAKAPTTDLSGLNSTALELAVYASCRRLLAAARNTRFRLLASSAGRDWLPTGFQRKVSALCPYIASPFPKLCLAQGRSSFPGKRAACCVPFP